MSNWETPLRPHRKEHIYNQCFPEGSRDPYNTTITDKADWDILAKKVRHCPDPEPSTNPPLDDHLQSLLQNINAATMEAMPISRNRK